jgi:hypothetical protein
LITSKIDIDKYAGNIKLTFPLIHERAFHVQTVTIFCPEASPVS